MSLPSPPPIFNGTADSILREAQQLIEQARSVQDSIASNVTPEAATFDNTLLPIAEEQNIRIYGQHMLEFYQNVSPDEAVRQASRDAEKLFSDLETELGMREDIAVLVRAICKRNDGLDEECRRFLEKQMLKYKRNGLHLPAEKRDRLHQVRKELADLKVDFEKNLSEESGGIGFTTEKLHGLPMDTLAGLSKYDTCMHRLTFRWSHVNSALQYVKNASVRRQVYLGHMNKCNHNVPLLEKAIALRDEAARLLGYANHAEYRLEDKMESSPKRVNDFLDDMRAKLMLAGQAELERLKQLKAQDLKEKGEEDDGKFYLWDRALYSRLLVERDYAVDQENVAEYFPLDWTIEKMLEIFAGLFGLDFQRTNTGTDDNLTWHEDVRMFAVYDDSEKDGEHTKEFVGYLYMDLHPRPGKYQQLADLSVHPVCTCFPTLSTKLTHLLGLHDRQHPRSPLHGLDHEFPQIEHAKTITDHPLEPLATLSRTRPRPPRSRQQDSIRLLSWASHSSRLLRSAESNARKVLLDARSPQTDEQTLEQPRRRGERFVAQRAQGCGDAERDDTG